MGVDLKNTIIGFIGAGNMATSLIKGLLASGKTPSKILAADIDEEKIESLYKNTGIGIRSNQQIADQADLIVLAVKPQVIESVCLDINLPSVSSKLIVSIAAGTTVIQLEKWLGNNTAIVRCMPNTPALIGKGTSGLFANNKVNDNQKILAQEVMETVGISAWVKNESDIDSITALSGSGPAYFFLFMEAMQEAAQEFGLSKELAESLIFNTAIGAAELAKNSEHSTAELRERVTSPGGTTQHAISVFESGDLKKLVHVALRAARNRSIELSRDSDK